MIETMVAVIGGGLAGLNAARLLHRAGVDFQLCEARDRLGGRILSTEAGFDLGPSWYWPQMQPAIGALIEELGLPCFPQFSDGDLIFERMSREGPKRYPGFRQEPESFRLAGGNHALIKCLAKGLPEDRLHLNAPVSRLARDGEKVMLTLPGKTVCAEHVIAALPPRLLQAQVRFEPAMPSEVTRLWRDTPTWMAPHAKFFAAYDTAFWRDAGLSGTAQSMVGPMPEIHDATTSEGQPALFGFLGIGADERQRLGTDALTGSCIGQLARLFGPKAATPTHTFWKDWATDPLTATAEDLQSPGHPEPAAAWVLGSWAKVLTLAGSEVSASEAGYLAGAVEASSAAVATLLAI